LGVELTPSGAIGMTMSVQCREEIPFSTSDELRNEAADVQMQIKDFFPASFLPLYDVCKIWGAGAIDPRENQPVTSDIPALIFAGMYDPVTPPEWGKLTAETLSHSYYYEFPGAGHWVMRSSECSLQIALSFLQDPEQAPDSSCLASENGIQFIH
ncbi:MAG: alpha/beta hydrolase, partial [Omnitrophica WOR_2 bacterium]